MGLNVLSLFDGLSGGRIALERAGIEVDNYYASEIDKYAIQVSKHNYPDIIQLGDVTKVSAKDLPKIDLLIGGSPCQGFSFAGKQLNFMDLRSRLFFEFARLLAEIRKYNPDVQFMLENVRMKQEHQDVISLHTGVQPILINSALVSAQNRQRLYWTNIPEIAQPEDRGIFLKDIVEDRLDYMGCALRGRYTKTGKIEQNFECNGTRKANALTTVAKDSMLKLVGMADDVKGLECIRRIYSIEGKSPTLTTCKGGHRQAKIALNDEYYRRLTPKEYERLQTVPDDYTSCVSNSQRYNILGNGWTIDVICGILKNCSVANQIKKSA